MLPNPLGTAILGEIIFRSHWPCVPEIHLFLVIRVNEKMHTCHTISLTIRAVFAML
jgi:hypothetical protein